MPEITNEETPKEKQVTLIDNGGEPLEGCPPDWDYAHVWEDFSNKDKNDTEPSWRWDCGFKLDFDGALVTVCSGFYPPKEVYGPNWDGEVSIHVLGQTILEKKFEEKTLDELKVAVESYINNVGDKIGLHLLRLFQLGIEEQQ